MPASGGCIRLKKLGTGSIIRIDIYEFTRKEHRMSTSSFKVLKRQMPVTLWVHPEGRVLGCMFLSFPSAGADDKEQPADVINKAVDFLVFKLEQTDEIRFYNKSSIVRVEYWDGQSPSDEGIRAQPCRITMMDGALFDGEICKALPDEHSRLYDYMNDTRERFLTLRLAGGNVALVNKTYIVYISSLEIFLNLSPETKSISCKPELLEPAEY